MLRVIADQWPILTGAIATVGAIITYLWISKKDPLDQLIKWVGKNRRTAVLAGGLASLTILATPIVIQYVTEALATDPDDEKLRNFGLIIAAAVGAGFAAWRATVAEKQAKTAEASLANNKLSDAFNALAARQKVPRAVRQLHYRLLGDSQRGKPRSILEIEGQRLTLPKDATVVKWGDWETRDIEVPDIVTRAAAIDRLEGLAREQPENRDRIASILCLYVRETSKTEDPPVPVPEDLEPTEAVSWARTIPTARSDRELAVRVLAQINAKTPITIGLEGANLQRFRLAHLDLRNAKLAGAQMQEANLIGAQMQGANLFRAQMQGANLGEAEM